VEEGIHFQWHLYHRGRGDVAVGLFDADGRPYLRDLWDAAPKGRGRPKLGVVAREVTLLPRHWEWLNSQPGGASVALRRLVEQREGRVLVIAGADLAHVGPRFGEPPLDAEAKEHLRRTDDAAIAAAASGDAEAWWSAIAAEQDSTSICGFAPTYSFLRCAEPGPGRKLAYAESAEQDGSIVTVAALAAP